MKLLEPGRIGSMEVKNRIIMAAMGAHGLHAPDGSFSDRYIAYYEARAAGGVGLITTEATFVTQALEPFSKDLFSVASDKHLASMSRLAERLHSHGCKLSIQLTAGFGRVVPPPTVPEGVKPVSASETPHYSPVWPEDPDFICRAITTEEAAALAQSFGYAARRCREAGADCVELHGHEGYLLDQFMTGLWNRRTDRYGGSREKRLTLAREAIAAIQRDAGSDFPIIYRYGITHYLEGGREVEEGLWIARELEKMGVSALHVDAGCYETHWWPHPPQYFPPACMVNLSEKTKQVCSLPIIAVGKLQYPDVAEKVLVDGQGDFIAIGRGLLSEPEWVNKVESGKAAEIRPCVACHEGCKWQMITGQPTSCALNPSCGHEIEWELTPLKEKRVLLVIGGGPAGIEAACVGAQRGFEVTLWEASGRLGGNLWPAAKPDFKYDIADFIKYLTQLANRLPINIVLNKRAVAEEVKAFGADDVIVATGAVMEPCKIGGKAADSVLSAIQVFSGMEPEGKHVLVMGGGIMGTETALYLARQGKQVTISTRRDAEDLAQELFDHNNRHLLLRLVKEAGINVLAKTVPVRLEDGGVVVDQGGAEEKIAVDSVVFAGPMTSQNELYESLEDTENVTCIGDCTSPGRIMDAVWGGFNTVREIESN
ncbi:MAG: FAD-dependent oxidoreductase [Deltaproteobacteria bacterium]|nr:FAD-dependent oxidoreductase [Deltaproteobacteria bacterium]